MKAAAALAALIALTACQEPDGRADTIPVFYGTSRDGPNEGIVGDIEFVFGMKVQEFDSPYGAIHIYLYDEPSQRAAGETNPSSRCSVSLWSIPRSQTLAHEVGHALGLEHVSEPGNLMDADDPGGLDLDDDQIDEVRRLSWVFQQCRDEL